jgi:putative nucleotidyltransferase with HDIG domain
MAVLSLTSTVGQTFLNQPRYGIGTIAPRDIRAPADASVVDEKTTAELRKNARNGITPVLAIDPQANQQIHEELQRLLGQGDDLRKYADPFPYLDEQIVDVGTQRGWRSISPALWTILLDRLDVQMDPRIAMPQPLPGAAPVPSPAPNSPASNSPASNSPAPTPEAKASPSPRPATGTMSPIALGPAMSQVFGQAIGKVAGQVARVGQAANSAVSPAPSAAAPSAAPSAALVSPDANATPVPTPPAPVAPPLDAVSQTTLRNFQRLQQQRSPREFARIVHEVASARQRYANAQTALAAMVQSDPSTPYTLAILDWSERDWQGVKQAASQALRRMLAQGIPLGLPESSFQDIAKIQVESLSNSSQQDLAAQLVAKAIIQPNLVPDPEQTKARAEKAAEDVPPQVVSRRQGELVVRRGETIDAGQFALLDHYGLSRRSVNWWGLLGLGSLVTGGVVIFGVVERRVPRTLRCRDRVLVLLLALSVPMTVWAGRSLPSTWNGSITSLPAVGLLAGSFYGSAIGSTTVALLTLVLPVGMELEWNYLIASAAGGLLGAWLAGQLRSREELAFLGVAVGITQGVVYLVISLMWSAAAGSVWSAVLMTALIYGLTGLVWSIVAIGISPYLEHLFDVVTPIRLAELASPNRPLLQRLAAEAPGTFQHTLFVASLAEAAARALGCNVELVRAGTLYHDIGKMHDPLGFIENQMGGPNKHDIIDDPWKSVEIIRKHVSEGLVMARRCRLPKAVQAFIPEHQGTMLIAYFYYQAKQQENLNTPHIAALPGSTTDSPSTTGDRPTPPHATPSPVTATTTTTAPTTTAPTTTAPTTTSQTTTSQTTTSPATTSESTTSESTTSQTTQIAAPARPDRTTVLSPVPVPPLRSVQEEDFRYAGPIPQSRETGIVMLADSCEAALRSLKDATYEEALSMVKKILYARWKDNQLTDSGLRPEEMEEIAKIFVRVWQQVNHQRIAYPKAVLSAN